MAPKTLLRGLLLAEFLLAVAFLMVRPEGSEAETPAWELIVVFFVGIGGIVARIGLFVLWGPARMLFLLTSVVDVLAMPFVSESPDTRLSAALNETALYIAGGILALIYFSPVRDLFAKSPRSV